MDTKIYESFKSLLGPENVLRDEPMEKHTTFRIGGPADYYLVPQNTDQVQAIINICRRENFPCFILGNGSNLLVSDEGVRGAVLQIFKNISNITVEGNRIKADAGALLSQAASAARMAGLTGFEFAGGIPGTVGGACVMNAGAYGGEMKQVLESVTVLDREGNILDLKADELELGYRTSIIKTRQYTVLQAVIRLTPGEPEEIKETMKQLAEQRISKQPLDYPSAGSTFKRPEGYFAGKLIMDAGLKGYSVGDAQVSPKHCGFVINTGHATAAQVSRLMQDVTQKVWDEFHVKLEPEVKMIGNIPGYQTTG